MEIVFYIFISILVFRLLRFYTTPLLKKIGYYKYFSPMFFAAPLTPTKMDIHLGTSWDFFKLEENNPKMILYYVAEGLLTLCTRMENGDIKPNTIFRGNIHYLKDSTVQKFGFKTRKLNYFELVLFGISYLEICFLKSVAKRKIVMHKVQNVKIAYSTGYEILIHKQQITKSYYRLKTIFDKPIPEPKLKPAMEIPIGHLVEDFSG